MIFNSVRDIQKDLHLLTTEEVEDQGELLNSVIRAKIDNLPEDQRHRVQSEFFGWGPLDKLMKQESVSEILINSPEEIWFEQNGKLCRLDDSFQSATTFKNFVFRIDFGFKTYNPSDTSNKKWFRDYNFANSVLNIGINYPF